MNQGETYTADAGAQARPFDEAERTRFHNLLKLAAESPYEGERSAALAAAERLATRHGMTLDEAASGGPEPELPKPSAKSSKGPHQTRARDVGRSVHMMDNWVANDKARRDEAMAEAKKRGLDAENRRKGPVQPPRRSASKRNPYSHAKVLLKETSLPMLEICSMTGLDIYEVVGLKLKMRSPKTA